MQTTTVYLKRTTLATGKASITEHWLWKDPAAWMSDRLDDARKEKDVPYTVELASREEYRAANWPSKR